MNRLFIGFSVLMLDNCKDILQKYGFKGMIV